MLEDSRLQSFSIGLEGSPDHAAARIVADAIGMYNLLMPNRFPIECDLGTHHHEIPFTVQEALDALPEVVRHLETYDVTTIRASTPMFLLSRAIKARGIKMVLSGEGSDEIFGGYVIAIIVNNGP
jgi:asparagine synthase (glutamine-hydrolysing)